MNTKQLRQKILDLAIRGKLVPQDPNDEPASVLLERIRREKERLVKEGKIKKSKPLPPIKAEDVPFELPSGWRWERLNNLYNFIDYRGVTPQKVESGVPLVTAKNVKPGYIDYSIDEYISKESYEERKGRGTSHKGDILFTTEAPLGNVALADLDEYSAGQRLITFQNYSADIELKNRLFVYFLLSSFFREQLDEKRTGTTVAGIKSEKLKQLLLPVPPVSEQLRISSVVESAFAVIDEIERNKADLQTAVAAAKSKILSLAIRGKLVGQDEGNEPVKSIKAENEHIPYEIPSSWIWAKISNACESQETKRPDGEYFRYIDIDAIDNKRHTVTAPKTVLTNKAPSRAAKGVRTGDTLFSMVRPYLENIAYITDELGDCIASTGFYICRPRKHALFPRFMYYILISRYAIDGINSYMRGDNSPAVRKNKVDEFLIPLPPLKEQKRIVTAIEGAFAELDRIAETLM
jgi:type I restriction enzyme S subunit